MKRTHFRALDALLPQRLAMRAEHIEEAVKAGAEIVADSTDARLLREAKGAIDRCEALRERFGLLDAKLLESYATIAGLERQLEETRKMKDSVPELSLVERLLHRAEQTELRAPYADAPASEALPRMETMLADAKLDREAADALAHEAVVREELWEALRKGLNLCARARRLADMDETIAQTPEWRSGTIPLWAEEQYQADLADWESRARAALAKAAPDTERPE